MKKTFRAAVLALAAVIVLALLCACGEEHEYQLFFSNKTGVKVDSLYFSSSSIETWGDRVNFAQISVDATIHFDFDSMNVDGDGPGVYDIGAVDENGINYDVFEVDLAVGDTITLYPQNGEEAVLSVTHADGTVSDYSGFAYAEGEAAG